MKWEINFKYGFLPLVKYLTENGGDVNAENINDETPLYLLILAAEQEQEKQRGNKDCSKKEHSKVVQ